MVSILIEETGEYLDLQREFVGLNYQIYDLGSIETRQGTFSNDFEIPNTSHNRAALGNATQVNIKQVGLTPYVGIPAKCFENNILISKGVIQINDSDRSSINITFYGDNVDVFELLRGKSIRDADLSNLRHTYTAANIVNSFTNTSGYIYLPIDYGLFTERVTNDIAEGEIFPAIFMPDILSAMFTDIGYKLKGTLLNRALLKKSVLPFCNNAFGYSDEFVKNKSFYADNIEPVTFNQQRLIIAPGVTIKHDFARVAERFLTTYYSNELFSLSNNRYVADAAFTINVRYGYDFRDFANNNPGATRPTVYIYKNGVLAFTSLPTWTGITTDIALDENDYLEFYVKNNHSGNISYTGVATGSVSQEYRSGSIIYPETVLPDISQVDFLKFILFRFIGVISVDPFSKTVYLNQFNDIRNKPSEDWSNKVDMSKPPVTNYSSILKNYAKVNRALYAIDEEDKYQKEYNSDNTLPFGAGQFTLANDFLENEKDIYDTPFSGTFLIESFDANKVILPYIPRYLDPADITDINIPKPRVLTVYGTIDLEQIGTLSTLDILGTSVSEIPFAYFYKSTYGFEVDAFKESLAFGVQNIFAPNDLGAFESDYLYLISILMNPEITRAYIKLNQIDLVNLDFLKRKYFERFGGYFYLNIIEDYDASGDSVECELIKV